MRTSLTLMITTVFTSALLTGCQAGGSPDDPHRGDIKVASIDKSFEIAGYGKPPLSLIVINGGWLKVIDVSSGELIHTSQIPAVNGGLEVMLDPNVKAITYNIMGGEKPEKPQMILPINPDHTYEVYFQR